MFETRAFFVFFHPEKCKKPRVFQKTNAGPMSPSLDCPAIGPAIVFLRVLFLETRGFFWFSGGCVFQILVVLLFLEKCRKRAFSHFSMKSAAPRNLNNAAPRTTPSESIKEKRKTSTNRATLWISVFLLLPPLKKRSTPV